MSEHRVKLAKPDTDDFDTTHEFLIAAELALDSERYSMSAPEDKWERDLDEDDADYLFIIKLRKRIADEQEIKEDEVDNRILMYEFLQNKFRKASCNWRRVYWAASVLIDNCTDPTVDTVEWHPGCELFHVAPEQ